MQLKLIICASLFGFCFLGLQAQTAIYVSPNANGNGSSWQNPSNIQHAITNANSNDTIKLKQGVYNLRQTLKADNLLHIYGGYSGNGNINNPETYKSILDGGGQISLLTMEYGSSESIIDGVYFQNGFGSDFQGGALSINGQEVEVFNCVFENNVSKSNIGSGAIYVRGEDVLIQSSRFQGNQVIQVDNPDVGTAGGGAIHIRHVSNTFIIDCEFLGNTSYYSGGAIDSWGENTKIEDCSFSNNYSEVDGGAIYKIHEDLLIENCEFTGNTANGNGGAISNNMGPLIVEGSIFKGNSAMGNGGGMHLRNDEISLSKVYFENNNASLQGGALYNMATVNLTDAVFWKNTAEQNGGAIYNWDQLALSNVDFVANKNSAYVMGPASTTKIYNSIFYANTSPESPSNVNQDISVSEDANTGSLDVEIKQNILQQTPTIGVVQDNLVSVNPLFINTSTGNFKLQHSSPGIDAGKANLYNSVSDVNAGSSKDLGGDDRLTATNIDLGAYEYNTILNCTELSNPTNGSTDVTINTSIQWNAVSTATGYRLSIGTTSGGNDIVNNQDVGNVTSYSPTENLPEDTMVYVQVVPYNNSGEANACSEEHFTTEKVIQIPNCTGLSSPLNGATDVIINTSIQWTAVTTATGYRLSIGTTPGGVDIVNNVNVGDVTSYTPTADLPEDTTIYVKIVPYNEAGDANGCLEEHFITEKVIQIPNCTGLSSSLNGATDVALNTSIQWTAVTTATGYSLSIGTTSGGTDILNNQDVGDVTSYSPTVDLPEDTTIYVKVIPYNEAGDATGCLEESFTTEKVIQIPNCTGLSSPLNGATDVAVNTSIQWNAVTTATGYRLSIGTTPGGVEIANTVNVGDVTSYTPTTDLPEDTTIYVRVVPYNEAGDANGCLEESFTTEKGIQIPNCTGLSSPLNGSTDVAVNTSIQWNAVTTATGYRLSLGTTPGGTDIINNQDVGNITSYTPTTDLPEDTTIYVSVIPYNDAGGANGCLEEYFITEKGIQIPNCSGLSSPLNGSTDVAVNTSIQWAAKSTATGYRLSLGTTPGGTDIVDNQNVGDVTSYTPTIDLPEDTTIYVRVVPYNDAGDANACSEEYFTTETFLQIPNCTSLTLPSSGATDVAVNTSIQWSTIPTATGYRISIGTSSGGTDIINDVDVGDVTVFTPTTDLPEDTTIYIKVIPYNEAGDATGCLEESFTTEKVIQIPNCSNLISPLNSATDVAVNTNIQWTAVTTATGYRLSIGTTSGGTDIVNNLDVGDVTFFTPTTDIPEDTTIYVKVIPYNEAGDATGCLEEYFVTELISDPNTIGETKYGISPNGDSINDYWEIEGIENFPDNVVSVFNRWGDMVYQVNGYDNQAVSFYGVANKSTAMGAGVLPSGTYFFKIEINAPGNSKTIKGFIVLKR